MFFATVMLLSQAPPIDLANLPSEAKNPAKNYYQDYEMAPVCSPPELERLRNEAVSTAGLDATAAWPVAYSMLCGTSRASERFVRSHMPDRVVYQVYPADVEGSVSRQLVDRHAVETVRGLAWDASVGGEPDELTFGYSLGGVCVASFTLRRVHSSWLIVEAGEACD